MLQAYRYADMYSFINEMHDVPGAHRHGLYQPGDIIRSHLFEDDVETDWVPVGLVVWVREENCSDAVGVLWSH